MDAEFISDASALIMERNRIGFLLKAIEEKHPIAAVVCGVEVGTVLDMDDCNGLETDLRKALAKVDDLLIAGGVSNLPNPVPSGSLADEISRMIGDEDDDEDDEDDESAAA